MENVNYDLGAVIFLVIVFLLIIVAIAIVSSTIHDLIKSRRLNSKKEETFNLLISRFKGNALNAEFVRTIYEEEIIKEYDCSLEDYLKSFLIYITTRVDGDGIKGIEQIINPLIKTEKTFKPYSNIDEEERRWLLAIEASAKSQAGVVPDLIKFNLNELSFVLEKKQKLWKNSKKWTWISITIGLLGLLLTIFSFVHKPSISEKSIKSISTEFSKQMDSILKPNVYVDTVHEFVGDEVAN